MSAPYHNKALPQGTIVREWRLEEVLGSGGFGIVYRGKGVYFGEDVAIKEYFPGAISERLDGATVAPSDSASEEIYELGRQKFLEEAKVLWNLSRPERHPNIVSVRGLFEIHGTAYMVMDFESGTSLGEMLDQGHTFGEEKLLAIIRPIAEGLDRAHRAGVLHRDIKPANILIDQRGRPVLIDFGSARFDSGQATSTKVTFYTPPYAAIEQYVKTFPQGPWTDIYALGVVLYQCVTGEKPPEVLDRLHGGLGRPLSEKTWPGYSPAFIKAVDAAMAIQPTQRPHSIADWLKLFDGGELKTIKTRIKRAAAPRPAEPAAIPAGAVATVKPTTARLQPAIIGSLAALLVISLSAFLLWPRHKPSSHPMTTAVAANDPAPADKAKAALGSALDGMIAVAQKTSRPESEISALTDAKTKILAAQPGQRDDAAREMATAEFTALGRTSRRMWRELGAPPTAVSGAAATIGKLEDAKADLDTKLAADLMVLDAAPAAEATEQALEAFGTFSDAYAAAAPVYVAARKKELSYLMASAKVASDEVVLLAGVSKPWFLASQARKNAYQLRQDNAAQARALFAQLSAAAGTAQDARDIKPVNGAIAQLTTGVATLRGLRAASDAAKL